MNEDEDDIDWGEYIESGNDLEEEWESINSENIPDEAAEEEEKRQEQHIAEKFFRNNKKLVKNVPVELNAVMGYSKKTVEHMLDLSAASYSDQKFEKKEKGFPDLQNNLKKQYDIEIFKNDKSDIQFYVFKDKISGDVTISFRGTVSKKNIQTDLNISRSNISKGQSIGKSHKGFNDAYNSIKDQLYASKYLKEAKDNGKLINLTGHSLGGALATLCALDLRRSEHNIGNILTFGAPRVFNREGAKQYHEAGLSDKTLRIVQDKDLVPKAPKALYKHVGIKISLQPSKNSDRHKKTGYKEELKKTDFHKLFIGKNLTFQYPPERLVKNLEIQEKIADIMGQHEKGKKQESNTFLSSIKRIKTGRSR